MSTDLFRLPGSQVSYYGDHDLSLSHFQHLLNFDQTCYILYMMLRQVVLKNRTIGSYLKQIDSRNTIFSASLIRYLETSVLSKMYITKSPGQISHQYVGEIHICDKKLSSKPSGLIFLQNLV